MEPKFTIEARRNPRRRNRDQTRNDSAESARQSRQGSQSPPQQSRVVILAKNKSPAPNSQLASSQPSNTTTPVEKIQIIPSIHSNQPQNATSTTVVPTTVTIAQPPSSQTTAANNVTEETLNDMIASMPTVIKLIDNETLLFNESPAIDYMFTESISGSGFSIISAVGVDGSGKSSVLNLIAGKDVFRVHHKNSTSYSERPLRHRTKGIDLHITKERLFLLDSQPLLSASVLDEYLQKSPPLSSSTGVDISEPENYSFMISLQLLSFLLATCDYVLVVCDWVLDIHLVKLIATAIMMVGDTAQKADIICYFPNSKSKLNNNLIDALLGRSLFTTVIYGDERELLNTVMKAPNRRSVDENGRNSSHSSEKSWLLSSQRYWESSIRKSTLFSDYGRFLP